eukprot:743099_1
MFRGRWNSNWTRVFRGHSFQWTRIGLASLTGALSCVALSTHKAHACGIVGYVGNDPAVDYLMEGLTILQNRGYDSAGIATVRAGEESSLITTKVASRDSTSDSIVHLGNVANANHNADTCGIAHTRWATHGAKTDENAHPHVDYKNRIALVHNGTIENAHVLKKELIEKGIPFTSETDTEVIAQLIGIYLDEGLNLKDSLIKTMDRIDGTYGLAIVHKDSPNEILCVRHGSPLVIGIGDGKTWIASEHSAFVRHTNQYLELNEGEMATLTPDGISIDMKGRLKEAPKEHIDLSPEPYPHWTIKEIMEQPEAIARSLKYGSRLSPSGGVVLGGLDEKIDSLLPIKHLMIGACGTSLFAAMYGAKLMRMLDAFQTVQPVDAAELDRSILPRKNGGLLVVSQSGETKDVMRTVNLAQARNIFAFSIINAIGSNIARATGCGVYVHAGREHAVASTKAFVTQVTCLALVACWFAQNRENNHDTLQEKLIGELHNLPTYAGMTLHTRPRCAEIARKMRDAEHIFVLGKGFAEPIAKEGALKIKEITYIHAEGYSGGALKHGPFALIEEGTPIIMLILNDKDGALMRTAAEEVKARGAHVIAITDKPSLVQGITEDVITIPSNGSLTALLGVIPLQLIAYELAVMRGINPDKPKNLAKAVTVD